MVSIAVTAVITISPGEDLEVFISKQDLSCNGNNQHILTELLKKIAKPTDKSTTHSVI